MQISKESFSETILIEYINSSYRQNLQKIDLLGLGYLHIFWGIIDTVETHLCNFFQCFLHYKSECVNHKKIYSKLNYFWQSFIWNYLGECISCFIIPLYLGQFLVI